MKKELLTVKELSAELRMSVKSIQRAYREARSPWNGYVAWRGSISQKFNGQWNATDEDACCVSTSNRYRKARSPAKAGDAPREQPPLGKTGALPTQIVTGGPKIL